MNAVVRQTITVQSGGVVHFASPQLAEGTQAEVIVLLLDVPEPTHRLAAFQALQQSLALTPATAEKWTLDAASERKTLGPK